jgi:hypothetical protein
MINMYTKDNALNLLLKLTTQELLEKRNIYRIKEKRYTELLKNPERSQDEIDNWYFYVPSFFNDCLDIAKTTRVINHKDRKIWTQGSRFNFHRGCVIYDTSKAYDKWDKAFNEIKHCITIISARQAKPAINHNERDSGEVVFLLLSPSTKTMTLNEIGTYKLTQDEFIGFLINGNFEILYNKQFAFADTGELI